MFDWLTKPYIEWNIIDSLIASGFALVFLVILFFIYYWWMNK